ncbi:MAG: Hpt domain-containing protein, partial [Terriglobales bacterium]
MTPQDEMRQVFFESAAELLQKLNDEALRLETNPRDREAAREIRRIVHTIKGDSAVLGFRELTELAHELEDVLAPETGARDTGQGTRSNGNPLALDPRSLSLDPRSVSLAQVVLSAADMFDAMLAAYQGGLHAPSGDPLRAMIWKLASTPPSPPVPSAMQPKFAWSDNQRVAAEEASSRQLTVFNIAIKFAPDCPMRAAGAELVHQTLQSCGDVLACAPERSAWADANCIEAVLATHFDEESLSAKLFIPGVTANLVVQRWTEQRNKGQAAWDKASESGQQVIGTSGQQSALGRSCVDPMTGSPDDPIHSSPDSRPSPRDPLLRVDAAKIDALLDLVGELIIGKSMLQQAIADFSQRHPKDPLRARLADALAFQSQALRSLQRHAMAIRMVPVEQLFRPFPRLVRDVARACGKQATLETCGQETELDKALVDALAEPLGHIVRNAIGHGIETPEERLAAGKPAAGIVRLNAYHQCNQMVIEVSD